MKTAEIIAASRLRARRAAAEPGAPAAPALAAGAGDTSWPGPDALDAVDDDVLALGEAARSRPQRRRGVDWPSLTRRCCALLSAPTTIDIVALLVGRARRRAGWRAPRPAARPRGSTVTSSPSTSSRAVPAVACRGRGLGMTRAQGDRVGAWWRRCCRRNRACPSGRRCSPSGRRILTTHGAEAALVGERSAQRRARCAPATGKTTYIGSWLTMVASTPELGLTTLPTVDRGAADLAVDRRADLGVAEIDLRLRELRLGRPAPGP